MYLKIFAMGNKKFGRFLCSSLNEWVINVHPDADGYFLKYLIRFLLDLSIGSWHQNLQLNCHFENWRIAIKS
jgi:hypothetical protein